ncbi:MAG: tripartite tricarboxylate transporter substrate binding protein, partial [Deltaproteobacteria bacterium]
MIVIGGIPLRKFPEPGGKKMKKYLMLLALFIGVSLITGPVAPTLALAKFPEKEITLVCPWPPGGSSDLITRTIAKVGAKYFPKPIIVINKAGANGVVATTESVRTPADGYTLIQGATGLFTSTIIVQKTVGYKQEDFDFLMGMTNEPMVLTVHPSSPYKSLDEMIKNAKEKDLVIRYSNSGLGGFPQVCVAYLFQLAGVKSQPIPFKGGGPAMTAILGAHVDMGVAHPGEVIPHVKAGKLRPLAISSVQRFSGLPEVPTMKEKGYNVDMGVKKYLFVPKGLPDDVRRFLVGNLTQTIRDNEFKNAMIQMDILWEPLTGKEVVDHLNSQYPILKKLLEEVE